jgi:ribonucleoside-diphosphate reductase alpha chain
VVSGGSGATAPAPKRERIPVSSNGAAHAVDAGTASMNAVLGDMMGDAPLCDICGHITVRNGSCYKCLNCGNSLGCS